MTFAPPAALCVQIAAELTARNIPTKEGNTQWQHQTVAYILRRAA